MIKRSGNFGFVSDGAGKLYSFSVGATSKGWAPQSFMVRGGRSSFGLQYMAGPLGRRIIPYGHGNDLPGKVVSILENFYAGEGIMGKKAGLQWGQGPRFYHDAVDESNNFYRKWLVNPQLEAELKETDWIVQMQRCLVDLCHMEGFWVKIICNRGRRIGRGRIVRIEHVPVRRVRFVYPGDGQTAAKSAIVADFPNYDNRYSYEYPLFDPRDPFRHAVSLAYCSIYSFSQDFYSIPRFFGAFDWLELAGTLAPLLAAYNENASAISLHIESPASYWEKKEQQIKDQCAERGIIYDPKMMEDFKDTAMEYFAQSMSGGENAGKFFHTSQFFNPEANDFEGWKVTPIDKKVKDYIDAQVAICEKAETAATSGFGLDPVLSNLMTQNKLSSGSEKLYSFKVYNATETAIPDMVLCQPWQWMIEANHPELNVKIGLYRTIVETEQNISPANRMKSNENI